MIFFLPDFAPALLSVKKLIRSVDGVHALQALYIIRRSNILSGFAFIEKYEKKET